MQKAHLKKNKNLNLVHPVGFDQLDFDAVIEWTNRNSLHFKCNKTKALLFGAHTRLSNVDRNKVFREKKHEIVYVRSNSYL